MGANIKDVAQKAGVSVTTVSRVLNNRGSLSEKTKEKVSSAMRDLNYYPNQVAVNLFKKRTQLVGMIVPDVSHPFYATEIKYIERELYAAEYKLMLCNSEDSNTREREYLNMLQCNKVDGIIIASHTLHLEDYSRVTLPVVALDRYLGKNIPTVSSDHEQGGRLAAAELIGCGCKNAVQIIGYSQVSTPSNERHIVFEREIKKNGAVCSTFELPLNAFSFSEYVNFVEKILKSNKNIDGIFAADNIACAACKVAGKMGIDIPKRLKILGYDGTEISLMPEKSLTTIRQNIGLISKTTVEILISMIEECAVFEPETHFKIPVEMVRRETSLRSATRD